MAAATLSFSAPGATLESVSRPSSAIRISAGGRRATPAGSVRGASKGHALGDLGLLNVTGWKHPEHPQGLRLKIEGCDEMVAKAIYEAAVRGDGEAVAAALAPFQPAACDGEGGEGEGEASRPPLPTIIDVYGLGPLMIAAGVGKLDVVTALLEAKAEVNAKSVGRGETALLRAARLGHAPVVTALLEHGASPKLATSDGATPLHQAARRGHVDVVDALLSVAGIDCGVRDLSGRTPLMCAAEGGHAEVASKLIEQGAPVNAADDNGWTALLLACRGNHSAAAELLGASGATLEASTKGNRTAAGLNPSLATRLKEQREAAAEAAAEAEAEPE